MITSKALADATVGVSYQAELVATGPHFAL